jgi:hypothetical protein
MIEENEQKRQQEIEQRRASTNFSRDYNEDRLERFLAKQSILEKRSRDIIKEKESELDSLESQQSKKYNTELMDDVIANTRKDIKEWRHIWKSKPRRQQDPPKPTQHTQTPKLCEFTIAE